ncbi:MAG TPA: CBS domain-containing protein [Candidatus Limnocylindria bacterium]|jgi:CBS domain-containing protein|nr:CBS domain-containing protein [Candidatus Limnocylindria bacterium]
MSPRAAWRLETLGFTDVYEYSAGKSDWGAYGLPLEGKAKFARIKDITRPDVPTCGIDDTVAIARERSKDWGTCIVVNAERVVLGRMFKKELAGDPDAGVADVMRPGPSTFRPNVSAIEMLEYMDRNRLDRAPVTTSDGRLVGLVLREDAERAAGR